MIYEKFVNERAIKRSEVQSNRSEKLIFPVKILHS